MVVVCETEVLALYACTASGAHNAAVIAEAEAELCVAVGAAAVGAAAVVGELTWQGLSAPWRSDAAALQARVYVPLRT